MTLNDINNAVTKFFIKITEMTCALGPSRSVTVANPLNPSYRRYGLQLRIGWQNLEPVRGPKSSADKLVLSKLRKLAIVYELDLNQV